MNDIVFLFSIDFIFKHIGRCPEISTLSKKDTGGALVSFIAICLSIDNECINTSTCTPSCFENQKCQGEYSKFAQVEKLMRKFSDRYIDMTVNVLCSN